MGRTLVQRVELIDEWVGRVLNGSTSEATLVRVIRAITLPREVRLDIRAQALAHAAGNLALDWAERWRRPSGRGA